MKRKQQPIRVIEVINFKSQCHIYAPTKIKLGPILTAVENVLSTEGYSCNHCMTSLDCLHIEFDPVYFTEPLLIEIYLKKPSGSKHSADYSLRWKKDCTEATINYNDFKGTLINLVPNRSPILSINPNTIRIVAPPSNCFDARPPIPLFHFYESLPNRDDDLKMQDVEIGNDLQIIIRPEKHTFQYEVNKFFIYNLLLKSFLINDVYWIIFQFMHPKLNFKMKIDWSWVTY